MLKAIIFDFDGTLIDSNNNTAEYFKATIKHFNYPLPADNAFDALFGHKTYDMWKKLFPVFSEDKIQELLKYSQKISLNTITEIEFFPDAITTLNALKKQYTLGLVTSRGKKSKEILFNHHKLSEYFTCVVDREDVITHKPNPEGLLMAMKELNVTPSQTIYVGDSKVDVLTAHSAGVPWVIISPLNENFDSDYLIKELSQLTTLIEKL